MKSAAFDYARARSAAHAVELLVRHPGSRLIAGGQSLGPMLNLRLARPERLVDIRRCPDFRRYEETQRCGDVRRRDHPCRDRGRHRPRSEPRLAAACGPEHRLPGSPEPRYDRGKPRERGSSRGLAGGAGRARSASVDRGPGRRARRSALLVPARAVRDLARTGGCPDRGAGAAALAVRPLRLLQARREERRVRAGPCRRARRPRTRHASGGDRRDRAHAAHRRERRPLLRRGLRHEGAPRREAPGGNRRPAPCRRPCAGGAGRPRSRCGGPATGRPPPGARRSGSRSRSGDRAGRRGGLGGGGSATEGKSGSGAGLRAGPGGRGRAPAEDPSHRERPPGRGRGRAPHPPRRLPARAPPPDRDPPRLRARGVRRVHRAHRRGPGPFVHRVRRRLRRGARAHHRGGSPRTGR